MSRTAPLVILVCLFVYLFVCFFREDPDDDIESIIATAGSVFAEAGAGSALTEAGVVYTEESGC